jgi:transcriptional regulator with XRE-family HTH domain
MDRTKSFTIGDRLRRVRELAGMSQNDVSVATGIAVSLISRYERNIINPGWQQISKVLEATGMTPCDLFHDFCRENTDETRGTFEVGYYAQRPGDPCGGEPPAPMRFRKESPLIDLLSIAAVDGRYLIVHMVSDIMVPDAYPGDLTLVDTALGPASGRIIAGYLDGEPVAGRLVRHHGKMYVVPSNRRYPPVEYDAARWQHRGCIIYSMRDLTSRFMAGKRFTDESSDVISIEGLGG